MIFNNIVNIDSNNSVNNYLIFKNQELKVKNLFNQKINIINNLSNWVFNDYNIISNESEESLDIKKIQASSLSFLSNFSSNILINSEDIKTKKGQNIFCKKANVNCLGVDIKNFQWKKYAYNTSINEDLTSPVNNLNFPLNYTNPTTYTNTGACINIFNTGEKSFTNSHLFRLVIYVKTGNSSKKKIIDQLISAERDTSYSCDPIYYILWQWDSGMSTNDLINRVYNRSFAILELQQLVVDGYTNFKIIIKGAQYRAWKEHKMWLSNAYGGYYTTWEEVYYRPEFIKEEPLKETFIIQFFSEPIGTGNIWQRVIPFDPAGSRSIPKFSSYKNSSDINFSSPELRDQLFWYIKDNKSIELITG